MASRIPPATVGRLPVYARALLALSDKGVRIASSQMIAAESRMNAAQLRKDLSHIGCFGTRGLGYEVTALLATINEELGLDRKWRVALVGFGKLGSALVGYRGFAEKGFSIVGIYDVDQRKVGESVGDIVVEPMRDLATSAAARHVDIGIVATPAESAQEAADALCGAGVTSILNFAPASLNVPGNVAVRNVDLSIEIQVLSFYQSNREAPNGPLPAVRL